MTTADRMRAACFAVLAGAILALAGNSQTAAATPEPVKVRAATHDGFGRLVFEWPAPIAVDSRRHGDRLTLRFARPFAADLGGVLDALGDYVLGLDHGADAREVVLRLAPATTARLDIEDDRIVVLDLMHAAAVEARRSGPTAVVGPGSQARVTVRTGVHDGFLRIVLDWPWSIEFAAEADGRRLRVRFEHAARIDAATIAERCRTLVDAASTKERDGWSELRLVLKAGVRPKVFKVEDRRVVIDLYEPSRVPPPAADTPEILPAQAPRPPNPGPPASTAPNPASSRPRSANPTPPDTTSLEPELPEPAAAPPEAESSSFRLEITAAEVEGGVGLDFVWSRPTAAAFLLRAGYLWSVFAPVAAPADSAVLPSLASLAPAWLGPGERVDAAGGIALRFPLRRPLAARVERAGERWRVVLSAAAAPPEAVRLERLADPPRLRIVTGEAGHVVRVTDPEVGDRLDFWPLLTPGRGQPRPQRLVDLELLATAQGLAWRAKVDQLGAEAVDGAVELLAPGGLRLSASSIAPPGPPAGAEPPARPLAEPPGEGFAEQPGEPPAAASTARPLPELPPTGQAGPTSGAADHPALPTTPARDQAAPAFPAPAVSPPLGLARFAPATRGSLADRRVFWQQRLLNAAAADRPAARLDLARFFLAHALGAEALALLGAAEPNDAPAGGPLELARQSLTGAAQLLMGRLDEAAVGLGAPALDGDPEAALWRAVLAAARADWPRAAQEIERSGTTLDGYPVPLQLKLGLPAARSAIEAGSQDEATRLLARLQALEMGPLDRDRVAFVDGLVHARRGAIDDADRIWTALEHSEDYQTRIEAGYARVQMLLNAGRLTPAKALAKLVAARPLWRPHPRELAMLDGLARLYLQTGEPARALHVWHEVLSHFPEAPEIARIAKTMRDSFVATLLPEEGPGIGALGAYALYREFPELVPDGALGDRLHRRLATQLAGLDLIGEAAGLLDPLLDHLDGAANAETGADLAELWLRRPDPAKALAALDRSRIEGELPRALNVQRQVLRARALVAQGQPDAALALLEGGADRAEQRLRAEILWQQRDWPRLISALENLLAMRADPEAPLAAAEQDLVIELAIAHARQGDSGALERLRVRFDKAMHGQAGEAAFLMATLPPARPAEPEAALAAADEQLNRVRAYLDTVRPAQ